MPHVVNGIGTWYWGRNNIVSRTARCEFCGAYQELTSFDTTLYFVVFFLPVIPLKKKRVFDQCPSCKRHRAMPLKKWEQQKHESLMKAVEAWQAAPNDPEAAKNAINTSVAFHDKQAFEDMSVPIATNFARDSEMQIYLGDAFDHFGDAESADDRYRSALAIRNDPKTRRRYAAFLLRRLRPDDARPYLADILTTKDGQDARLLLGLAQAYQGVGNHEAAAQLIDETGTAFPNLLSDAEFDRIRRTSAKYRGTNKRIKVAGLDQKPAVRQGTWFNRNGPKVIVGGIVAAAATWFIVLAMSLGKHDVNLINGTDAAYTIDVGGKRFTVGPMSRSVATIDEGKYTVTVPDRAGKIDPATIELKTSFWSRPFNRHTFILNPDRCALLYQEDIQYTSGGTSHGGGGSPRIDYMQGQVLYDLKKPDDPFTEPPPEVSLPSESSVVTRTHLALVTELTPNQTASFIKKKLGESVAAQWARRYAAVANNDLLAMSLLGEFLKPEEWMAEIRPRLKDRPLRLEWHRFYQNTMEREHPDYDLLGEYQKLLTNDPQNKSLIYLVARITEDRTKAVELFRKAAEPPDASPFALYALALDDLSNADFAAALDHASGAAKIDSKNPQFTWALREAHEALGQIDEALAIPRSQEKHDGHDYAHVLDEVRLLIKKGAVSDAKSRIDAFCQEVSNLTHNDKESVDVARSWLMSAYYYGVGDLPNFHQSLASLKQPVAAFESSLTAGKFAEAETALKQMEGEGDPSNYALLCACASGATRSEPAVAERCWKTAIDLMKQHGSKDDRRLATALESGNPPTDEQLRAWSSRPSERSIMLACLGLRYPQMRDKAFPLAAKLNYAAGYPQREVAKIVGEAGR